MWLIFRDHLGEVRVTQIDRLQAISLRERGEKHIYRTRPQAEAVKAQLVKKEKK